MKLSITLFLVIFCLNQVLAQQVHFLYIESESKKPFYARIGEKPYNSSQAGYLVIPKLSKGNVNFNIGFPRNEWSPQPFTLNISEDAGYLLRLSGESHWELVSLKDFSIVRAGEKKDTIEKLEIKNLSAEQPSPAPIPEPDSVKKPEPVLSEKPVTPAIVVIQRSTGASGFTGRYHIAGTGDTVDIDIPEVKPAVADSSGLTDNKRKGIDEEKRGLGEHDQAAMKQEKPREEKIVSLAPAIPDTAKANQSATCRVVATMNDFLRLRKNMAAQITEEAMTEVARKFLKSRCINVQQASNLGSLYLTDQGRYAFFDTCNEHVSDPAGFPALEKQLSDPYYINRFRAMLR